MNNWMLNGVAIRDIHFPHDVLILSISRKGDRLISPDGTMNVPQQQAPAAAAAPAEEGKLWTPDSPAPATSGGESKSKLWVPGMD